MYKTNLIIKGIFYSGSSAVVDYLKVLDEIELVSGRIPIPLSNGLSHQYEFTWLKKKEACLT